MTVSNFVKFNSVKKVSSIKGIIFSSILVFLFCNSIYALSDKETLQGRVTDFNTGEGIMFCSVSVKGTYKGTSTNDLGAFIVNTDALPVALVFNHIGYQEQTITITNNDPINIQLIPLATVLDAVLLNTTYNDDRSINLANAAIENMQRLSVKTKYGQAFYRQKSKNGDDYSELAEIIFDTKYNTNGVIDWAILEGRYASKEAKINNKNFTLLSKLLKTTQPDTEDLIFPLREDFERFYNVKTLEQLTSEKKQITVLQFKPKNANNKTPIFSGEIYVNTVNKNVLKVKGRISTDDLTLVTLAKGASKKDYELTYEITFKEDNILDLVIDYIKVEHNFDYYVNQKFVTKVWAESQLSFFNYYAPTSRKKLGGQFERNKEEWEKLNKIGYNKAFWKNNPIVKRTPVEESVIASYEKDNAFKTIYLNSNNQISTSKKNLSSDVFVKTLNEDIVNYKKNHQSEKLYLHTNKSNFFQGETLYYSIYNSLSSLNNEVFSEIVYVSFINESGAVVNNKRHQLDLGKGSGSIELSRKLQPGRYKVLAYTKRMQNFDADYFFTKDIEIMASTIVANQEQTDRVKGIDLQFFPEGGDAITGLNNRIAFKAIGPKGYNKTINAKIVNSKNESLAIINTLDNGSGYFNLTPKFNESYSAVLNDSIKIPITKIKEEGYTMFVNNLNDNSINLNISASENLLRDDFYVIGTLNQTLYYRGKFNLADKNSISIDIPKGKLPSGVMTLTVFNTVNKPVAERAIFINNQQELVISAKLSKERFGKRQKLGLGIKVTDVYGRPVSTDLSVSITDVDAYRKDIGASNILTHMLLESDIKGHIENPNRFFKDDSRSTKAKLDLLMMTHGWRRINWSKIQDNTNSLRYDFERDFAISGIIKNRDNAPLNGVTVQLVTESASGKGFYETKSGSKGRFRFDNIRERGQIDAIFRGFRKEKALDVNVVLDEDKNVLTTKEWNFSNTSALSFSENIQNKEEAESRRQDLEIYSQYSMLEGIALEEVLLERKKPEKNNLYKTPSLYNIKPDATVIVDDTSPTNFLNLLNKVAGVRVSGTFIQNEQFSVSIRACGPERDCTPLFVLDGVPVAISTIAYLQSGDIERIEVIKGPKKAIFGSRGANGVILIYTKTTTSKKSADSEVFNNAGLDISREFYKPNYSVKTEDNKKKDYRTTIYWNPSVKTNANGEAYLEFYNSDVAKQLQVSIEGMYYGGLPGYFLQTFGND